MLGNNVMGIIFSNMHEELIRELTNKRTMGSVPFGGRYRLIDFVLSNMVNSGINRVGVITKGNYQSLMDHLGSGKAWDLSRRRDGLFILPPFGNGAAEFGNRIQTLSAISSFLVHSKEEYVLISDCDVVCNINYQKVIDRHLETGADITMIYRRGVLPATDEPVVLSLAPDSRVRDIIIGPEAKGEYSYALNMLLIKRELLIQLVSECSSRNKGSFKRDILQKNVDTLKICGYEFEGYAKVICSMNSYFEANMSLMNPSIREELFNSDRPIYTKVRDDMPAKYGLGSTVTNSLVANGCVIEGQVENSVLFRGVHVGKGAKVSNCVIIQDTIIGNDCELKYVIADKDVTIKDSRTMMGFQSYPVYISKGSIV
ncbi:MAG TPA: glucose-1-phosphate adenylyltransferase subunit GlgD [Candidatus Gallacutalibacter stercoravium]|nr:glucose-1-phosphate adenylyltransferase subunit GlgD [Candidatus Gallacutalibacter stercoravium]